MKDGRALEALGESLAEQAVLEGKVEKLEARCAHLHKALRRTTRYLLDELGYADHTLAGNMTGSKEADRKRKVEERGDYRWSLVGWLFSRESRGWGKCPSAERMEEDGKA